MFHKNKDKGIMDACRGFLDSYGLQYEELKNPKGFIIELPTPKCNIKFVFDVDEEKRVLMIQSLLPNKVPNDVCESLYSLFNSLNKKYRFSTFYYDDEISRVVSRVSLCANGAEMSNEMITAALVSSLSGVVDSYDAILKVLTSKL